MSTQQRNLPPANLCQIQPMEMVILKITAPGEVGTFLHEFSDLG